MSCIRLLINQTTKGNSEVKEAQDGGGEIRPLLCPPAQISIQPPPHSLLKQTLKSQVLALIIAYV